jgi:hypothetical protein
MLAIGILGLGACDNDETTLGHVPTGSIEATIEVTQWTGGRVAVEAQLRQGEPLYSGDDLDYLDLTGGDELVASIGQPLAAIGKIEGDLFDGLNGLTNQHQRMSAGSDASWWLSGDLVSPYRASFDGVAVGQAVYVELYRDDYDDAAYSYAIIPAAFEIATPGANQVFSRATDAIAISWTPADGGAATRISAEHRCPSGSFFGWSETQAADTGAATIPAATFSGSGTCTLSIVVDRYTSGSIDGSFHHGRFLAHQKRRVVVSTDP